jgi:hypothetical protein
LKDQFADEVKSWEKIKMEWANREVGLVQTIKRNARGKIDDDI